MSSNKEKSLYSSYAMSYLTIIFLAVVIFATIFLDYYAKDLMKSYREMEEYKILQVETELNNHLDITNELVYKIRTSVMFYPSYFEKSEKKKMDILEQLSLYKGTSTFLKDFCLIYPGREIAFASNGALYRFDDLMEIVWMLEESENLLRQLEELQTFSILKVEKDMLWFCFPARFYTAKLDSHVVLVCRINKDDLLAYVEKRINFGEDQLAIFYNGELLVATPGYDATLTRDEREGFDVYTDFSARNYVQKFSLLQTTNILGVFVVLMILMISALQVAYYHARKVRNVSEKISSQMNMEIEYKGNELSHIEDLFDYANNLNRNYTQQLQKQIRLLKKHVIMTVINGKWKTEMMEQLELLHMDLNNKYFVVIRVSIPGLPSKEMETVVDNIEKLSEENIQYYAEYEENNDEIVIIMSLNQEEAWKEGVELVRERLQMEWKEAQISIGNVYSEINHVVNSYLEATVYSAYNPDMEKVQSSNIYHNAWVDKIEVAIMAANYEEAHLLFKKMIQEFKEINSMLFLQCMYSDVLSMLMRLANKVEMTIPQQQIASLLTAGKIDVFAEKTDEVIRILCEEVRYTQGSDTNDTMWAVKKYVEDHYLDFELAIETVAEEFQISATYLSRTFKKVAGKNYKEYITQLRIEYAKDLLRKGKTVLDVSSAAGYTNPSHFIRVFKKQTGITPKAYQEGNDTMES